MSEFIYIYRCGDRPGSPEEMQKVMGAWMAWMKDLRDKGFLKDAGHPLDRTGKVVRPGKTVTDGPFAEAKDLIGGYSVVEAKDANHAAELAQGCPVLARGGAVEVRPIMAM